MSAVSRRAFLVGVGTSFAAAILPAMPVRGFVPLGPSVAPPIPMPKYPGPFLWLHPSQWRRLEADGLDMRFFKLIEQIPRAT